MATIFADILFFAFADDLFSIFPIFTDFRNHLSTFLAVSHTKTSVLIPTALSVTALDVHGTSTNEKGGDE